MRILIADPQLSVRSALKIFLLQEPDLTVVAEASDSQELLAKIETAHPDLVLLDWELPGQPIETVLPSLRAIDPQLAAIALSGRSESERIALAAGANAFVSKTDPPARLLTAIRVIQLDHD